MFFCLLFVTLSNYEIFENGNAIKPCNFQYNYGAIAHRKVSSCAEGQLYTMAILGALQPQR